MWMSLPSTFVELWMAVFAACVYRIRSTPYFLLFNVLFGLQMQQIFVILPEHECKISSIHIHKFKMKYITKYTSNR